MLTPNSTCSEVTQFLCAFADDLGTRLKQGNDGAHDTPFAHRLDYAISTKRAAVRSAATANDLHDLLHDAASALETRYLYLGSNADLDEALDLRQQASNLVYHDTMLSASPSHHLSNTLRMAFERTGNHDQLAKALELSALAMSLPADDVLYPTVLANRAKCLHLRYITSPPGLSQLSDATEARALFSDALTRCQHISSADPSAVQMCVEYEIYTQVLEWPAMIPSLILIRQDADLRKFDAAVTFVESFVSCLSSDHIRHAFLLQTLAHAFYLRARATKDNVVLLKALSLFHQLLSSLPSTHVMYPIVLARFSFAIASGLRHKLCGPKPNCVRHVTETQEASARVTLAKSARALCPSTDIFFPVCSVAVCDSLGEQVWVQHDWDSLRERQRSSLSKERDAFDRASSELVAEWDALCIPVPASAFGKLDIYPRMSDVLRGAGVDPYNEEEIISSLRHGVPLDKSSQAVAVPFILGLILLSHYYGVTSDLNQFIRSFTLQAETFRMILGDDFMSHMHDKSVAGALLLKMFADTFRHFTTREDNLNATAVARHPYEASWGWIPNHEARWVMPSREIEILMKRLYREGNYATLDKVITLFGDWVFLITPLSGYSEITIQYCRALLYRFWIHGNSKDRLECKRVVCSLVDDANCPEANRLRAIAWWATEAAFMGLMNEATQAFDRALSLYSRLVLLHMDVKSRLSLLKNTPYLPCDAACHLLRLGQPIRAVEWLEKGRAVLWAQVQYLRLPENALDEVLAKRFREIKHSLQEHKSNYSFDGYDTGGKRKQLAEDFLTLLDDIRVHHPELQPHFRSIYTFSQLRTAAAEGPIVFLVPSNRLKACYAIIIPNAEVDVPWYIPLDKVELAAVQKVTQQFSAASRGAQETSSLSEDREADPSRDADEIDRMIVRRKVYARTQLSLLKDIWIYIVQPVVAKLGLKRHGSGSTQRPRLWWCPTGELSFLPLHAAGIYNDSDDDPDCISDYVVSSYTPTLNTLLASRRELEVQEFPPTAKVLLVPNSGKSLPSVVRECQVLKTLLPPDSLVDYDGIPPSDEGKEVTVEKVVKHLPIASVLHFACHGEQHANFPDESAFQLSDGHLSINRIMHIDLPRARFAFLSACSSAAGDTEHPDESVHMAATLQSAGFCSVIGTMWSMKDIDGPVVVEKVYSKIFESGIFDITAIPYALDLAVTSLRRSGAPVSRWATYIHLGV